MTWVALALVAANIILAVIFARSLRQRDRQHARERDLLLDRMMHLSGKPWNQAPAEEPRVEPVNPDVGRYVARPEILPE